MQVNIYEAKTRLSELVELAHNGESVIIAKAGTPMARLVPLSEVPKRRKPVFGSMKGEIWIAPDFDAPLPDEILALFDGMSEEKPASAAVQASTPSKAAPRSRRRASRP